MPGISFFTLYFCYFCYFNVLLWYFLTFYSQQIAKFGVFLILQHNLCLLTYGFRSFIFLNFQFFILGCAGSSLLHRLFCSCSERGLLSSCSAWVSHFGGFSCCGARGLGLVDSSRCSARALEHVVVMHGIGCSTACVIFPD